MFILLLYLRSIWNSWYLHCDTVLVWLKAAFSSSSLYRSNGTQLFLRETHTSSAPFCSSHSLRHQRRWSIWRGMTRELTHHLEVMVPNAPMTEATSIASPVTFSLFFFLMGFILLTYVSHLWVCVTCVIVPSEAKNGNQIWWNWSYRQLWDPEMDSGNSALSS